MTAAGAGARLPGRPGGGLLAGEFPQPGQFGLQLAGFLGGAPKVALAISTAMTRALCGDCRPEEPGPETDLHNR